MKILSAAFGAILLAVGPTAVQAHDVNQPAMPAPVYEYVQQAASMQSDGQSMTLQGVPSTVFFSDRPYRLTGQMGTAAFAKLWEAPNGPFAHVPPNAAVSVLGDTANPPAIVELTSAEATGDSIKYGVKILSGELPDNADNVALFADHSTRATHGVGYYPPYHPVPGPYCYHAPQAPECRYHPYHPYYPPYHPYHPGAAFAAGAVVGAAAASASQPKTYVYPIPSGAIPAQCYINSNHTRMICSVPIQQ